jgi:tetratricopeptide (TPR) repeat protein
MGNLWAKYPGDFEAAAFYSLAILGTSHGGRDFRTYMRAAAVAEEIFRKNPQHPGALHYLIHCYDDPVHAPLGLRAARLYAKIAPAAAHALHMPSHIFLALGMWDEVVSSNEDSWAASEERVKRKRLTVEDRGYHALWWLQYGYLQQGRYGDARRLLEIMEEDARRSPSRRIRYHLALMRAGHTIESGQQGKVGEELGLKDLDAPAEAGYLFARGYAAIGRGDLDAARKALEEIGTMRAGAAGGGAPHAGGHHPYPGDAQAVEIARKQLLGLIRLAEKNGREAVRLLEEAAGIEDQMSYEFGPPVPPKPAHELLGEILLNLERPLDARRHFERALARTPKRALSLLGLARAADRTGARELARDIYAELKSVRARADVQWEK